MRAPAYRAAPTGIRASGRSAPGRTDEPGRTYRCGRPPTSSGIPPRSGCTPALSRHGARGWARGWRDRRRRSPGRWDPRKPRKRGSWGASCRVLAMQAFGLSEPCLFALPFRPRLVTSLFATPAAAVTSLPPVAVRGEPRAHQHQLPGSVAHLALHAACSLPIRRPSV